MSTPPSEETADAELSPATEVNLHAALLERFNMPPETANAVYDAMRRQSSSFVEAALGLGYITQEQVDDALLWVQRHHRSEGVGLIETAIRRISSNRQVVLAQGEMVKPGPELRLALGVDNAHSEKIRALRTELLLLSATTVRANPIALLSASPQEGRSQLSAELAISFSQLGRRTLLVDADLRRPKQHLLFGSSNSLGLVEAISRNQKASLHPVDGLPFLSLLTSGTPAANPLELLSDGHFAKLMLDWCKSFEFLVIDTPPVQRYADGLAVARLAGRVMLLSRAKHTSFKDTRDLLRRLSTTQSQILGAVINHF